MIEKAVSNSACLIGLERIDRLDILSQSFEVVYIPPTVKNEIGFSYDWLVVRPVQNTAIVRTLRTQLDVGESEAIALAIELGDVLVVLDDKKARSIAQQIGLSISGRPAESRGVLDEASRF